MRFMQCKQFKILQNLYPYLNTKLNLIVFEWNFEDFKSST